VKRRQGRRAEISWHQVGGCFRNMSLSMQTQKLTQTGLREGQEQCAAALSPAAVGWRWVCKVLIITRLSLVAALPPNAAYRSISTPAQHPQPAKRQNTHFGCSNRLAGARITARWLLCPSCSPGPLEAERKAEQFACLLGRHFSALASR
jgi:hypothetical protein